MHKRLLSLQAKHTKLEKLCDELQKSQDAFSEKNTLFQEQLNTLHRLKRSRSWRWTYPFRRAEELLKKCFSPWHRTRPPTAVREPRRPQAMHTLIQMSSSTLRFEKVASPDVSIIIPVHNHFEYTYTCLHSIAEHDSTCSYEIIVVNDASTDATDRMLQQIPGVRVVSQKEQRGYTISCNNGARVAQGRYLVFLNNDCIVQNGWIDALISTFRTHKNAGLVGAKLLHENGTLQEAGCNVDEHGQAQQRGRDEKPDDPAFNYVRAVDYCSGACLAIEAINF